MRAWGAEEGAALQTIDDEFDDFEDEGGEGGGEAGAGPADATAAGGRAGAHDPPTALRIGRCPITKR